MATVKWRMKGHYLKNCNCIDDPSPPQFVPITFEFDKGERRARVLVPGALETVSAPLTVPATGQEQRVIVRMPGGMEYKEMEVAQAVVLKGTAAIRFDHSHTHSSLADVEQTHAGLVR